jgi:hypothetical protein
MNLDCSRLETIAHSLPLVEECDVVRNGALRMSTPFRYPNGEHVDIFLEQQKSLFGELYISDYGQTALYLKNAQISMNTTSRKREVIEDILFQCGVKIDGCDLWIDLRSSNPDDISDAMLRLSQACVRVSDLATHQRLRSSNPFRDDIEDFLDAYNFPYKADVKVPGPHGKDIKMDFEVTSGDKKSFVMILAAMNEPSAHSSATEIFTRWYVLREWGNGADHGLVTIYNSKSDAIREEDLARIRPFSTPVGYPQEIDLLVSVLSQPPLETRQTV